jgi:hypothetical protein
MLNAVLSLSACVMTGVAIGLHFGAVDGIAAGLTVYALMPYKTTR